GTVELLVGGGEPDVRNELTELVELGRLQRDGITRLDVHRTPLSRIAATPHHSMWCSLDDHALQAGLGIRNPRLERSEHLEEELRDGEVADPLAVGGDHVPRGP